MIGDLFDSPWKLLIVAAVIIVLFGSRKLPDAARSLGKSMRILKTEVQGLHEDETDSAAHVAPAQLAPTPSTTAAEAQIAALSEQIANLQQAVSVNSVPASSNLPDGVEAK